MKSRLGERVLFVVCFALLFFVLVSANQKNRLYYLFNHDTGKLYRYYLLTPGEKLSSSVTDLDSLVIYTRVILHTEVPSEYSYKVTTDNFEAAVKREMTISKSSRGVSGDKVSSWNSYMYFPMPEETKLTVTNNSELDLLVKISKPEQKTFTRKTEYIAYPPDRNGGEEQLLINEAQYTYYLADEKGITMQLEGPLLLKVVSRVKLNETAELSYSWKALLDGEEVLKVDEFAPASISSLANSTYKVTRGKVSILQVPTGIHSVKIMDIRPDDIIYRFYLNKTAIGNH
jgi:hypothetical protein